jgi:TetR/AcrR family transcriptional regulator
MARPRSDIEPRIVHAARRRFLREGVDGASLRTIAKDAGTSIGMVYYYYPKKDDLFFAVVEETYRKLLVDMTRALEPDAPVEERIRRLYARIGAVSDAELATVQLIAREVLVSSARLRRLFARFQRGHIPLVLGALADGVGDGKVDPALPLPLLLLATVSIGAVPQLVRRAMGKRPPFAGLPEGDALAELLVRILLHGIGTRAAVTTPVAGPDRVH